MQQVPASQVRLPGRLHMLMQLLPKVHPTHQGSAGLCYSMQSRRTCLLPKPVKLRSMRRRSIAQPTYWVPAGSPILSASSPTLRCNRACKRPSCKDSAPSGSQLR